MRSQHNILFLASSSLQDGAAERLVYGENPTHHHYFVALFLSLGCLGDVWRMSGRYLERVWKVSGMCLEGVCNVPEGV